MLRNLRFLTKLQMVKNKLSRDNSSRKWYYDACALEEGRGVIRNIINNKKKYNIQAFTSHLALGEAFGNSHKKGGEAVKSFAELIVDKLKGFLKIIGNDEIDKQIDFVKETCPDLATADRVHLATALRYKAETLVTEDNDFLNLTKSQLNDLADKCGYSILRIQSISK